MGHTRRSAVVLFMLGLLFAPARADGPVYAQATAPTVGGTCSTRPPVVDQSNHRVYVCESSVWKIRDLPECNANPPTTPSCAANAKPVCILTSTNPPQLWGCNSSNAWTQIGSGTGGGDDVYVDGTPLVGADFVSSTEIDFQGNATPNPDTISAVLFTTSIIGGKLVNNTITPTQLAQQLQFGSTDQIDLSLIPATSLNTGLKLPQTTACTLASATNGQVCWDNDTFKLYIGNGTAYQEVGGGIGDITSVGDCLTTDCFGLGTANAGKSLCFWDGGTSGNENSTCIDNAASGQTADYTLGLPKVTGTLCAKADGACGSYAQGLDSDQNGTNPWFHRTTGTNTDANLDITQNGTNEFGVRVAGGSTYFNFTDGTCTGTCPNLGWYCFDSSVPAMYACDGGLGAWQAMGGGGSGDVTAVGPGCATGACFTDGLATTGSNAVVWEGTGVDANEWTMVVPSNPAADYTVTFPSATGGVVLAPNTTYPTTQCAQWNSTGQLTGSGAACAGVPSTPDWAKLGIDYDANGTDPDLDMDDTRNNTVADIRRALIDVGHDGTDNLSIRQGSVLSSNDGDDACDAGDDCADVIIARPVTNAHVTRTGYKSIALTTSDDPYDYAGWLKIESRDGYGQANITCGSNFGVGGSCSMGSSSWKMGPITTTSVQTDGFIYNGLTPLSVGNQGIEAAIASPFSSGIRWLPYGEGTNTIGWRMYSGVSDYRFNPGIAHDFEATSTAERWAGLALDTYAQGRDSPQFMLVREASASFNKTIMQSGSGQPWIVLNPDADTVHIDTDGSGTTQPGYYFCNDTTRTNGDVLTFRSSDSCITTEAPGGLATQNVDIGEDGTNDYTSVPVADITGDGTAEPFPSFMKVEYFNDFLGDSVSTEHWSQNGTTGAVCGGIYSYSDNVTANATGAQGVTNMQPGTTAGNDCLLGMLGATTNGTVYEVRKMRQFIVRYRNQTVGTTKRMVIGGFTLNTSVDYNTVRTGAMFACHPTLDMNDDAAVGTSTDLEWWAITANGPTTSLSCNGTTGTSAIGGTGGCSADANRTATATGVRCDDAQSVMRVFKIWWDGTNMNFKIDNNTTIQHSTNIPANGTRVAQWAMVVEATSTTASFVHPVDYIYYNGVR